MALHCASLLSESRFYAEIVSGRVIDRAFQKLLHENFIPTSTVMVRRACFDTTGLFDSTLKGPEDRDMWSRVAAHFPDRVHSHHAGPQEGGGIERFARRRNYAAISRPPVEQGPASLSGARSGADGECSAGADVCATWFLASR